MRHTYSVQWQASYKPASTNQRTAFILSLYMALHRHHFFLNFKLGCKCSLQKCRATVEVLQLVSAIGSWNVLHWKFIRKMLIHLKQTTETPSFTLKQSSCNRYGGQASIWNMIGPRGSGVRFVPLPRPCLGMVKRSTEKPRRSICGSLFISINKTTVCCLVFVSYK